MHSPYGRNWVLALFFSFISRHLSISAFFIFNFAYMRFVPDLPHLPQEFCAYKLVPRVFENVVCEYCRFHASKRPGLSLWPEQSYFGRRINEIFTMPGRKVYVVGVGMTKVRYTLIILRWIWSQIGSRKLRIWLFHHSVARLEWLLSEILPCYDQCISSN